MGDIPRHRITANSFSLPLVERKLVKNPIKQQRTISTGSIIPSSCILLSIFSSVLRYSSSRIITP